ncbi:MAG: hypothetical protein KF763_07035 [Cyclobacteriaceae bacterium]|nr:hypothetical protein [Cyclobacteriaceae bacterium]
MNLVKLLVNLFQFNRTNWKAVSLCVLAAAVFWLFNAFNKSYSTVLKFPLRVTYNETRFVPIGNLPNELKLNVQGNGWDLFRKSIGIGLPELTLNIERPLELRKIPGVALPPLLAAQLNGLVVNHVLNDTLRVQFDERDVHTFRLVPDLTDVWFREGYGRTSPVMLTPDSVRIEGPRTLLHSLPDAIIIKMPQVTLDENYKSAIAVSLPDSLPLAVTPDAVTIMFEVGVVHTLTLRLPVELRNKPKLKALAADSCRVTVRVAGSQLAQLEPQLKQLVVWVDLKNKPQGLGAFRVLPALNQLPDGVELIGIDSLEIKF